MLICLFGCLGVSSFAVFVVGRCCLLFLLCVLLHVVDWFLFMFVVVCGLVVFVVVSCWPLLLIVVQCFWLLVVVVGFYSLLCVGVFCC